MSNMPVFEKERQKRKYILMSEYEIFFINIFILYILLTKIYVLFKICNAQLKIKPKTVKYGEEKNCKNKIN